MEDIRAKAEEWNARSTKKVPYEFVEFCEDKRSVETSGKQIKNLDIRVRVMEAGLKQYQIAGQLGISEGCLSGRLRKELTPEWREKILNAIEELLG